MTRLREATATADVPQLLRPNAAAPYIGISRTRLFELLREGEIPSRLVSPRVRLIPKSALDAYVERIGLRDDEQATTPHAPQGENA